MTCDLNLLHRYFTSESMFLLVLGFTLNVHAVETVELSYGSFQVHYIEPLEMEQAIEYCSKLNGRLPRFNNPDDYETLGAFHLTHNISRSWVRNYFSELQTVPLL